MRPSFRQLASTLSHASPKPPHLLSMADLTVPQIQSILHLASQMKAHHKAKTFPPFHKSDSLPYDQIALASKTIALLFSKRSTRTRVASESAVAALGGHAMFLGSGDIQLGVNETLFDTSKVLSSMVDGIMARVNGHEEVQTLAENSTVPVINALSDLYHPTQILADLLTLVETYSSSNQTSTSQQPFSLDPLKGLKVAWIGDNNNIDNDMIGCFGRLGIHLAVATPVGYDVNPLVLKTMEQAEEKEPAAGKTSYHHNPEAACQAADVVTTDTWISMGFESEKAQRMRDFEGFQVTMDLMKRSGAKPDWKFMHCLPRKPQEVDDEVFYSRRSLVFPEAENRKWTIMALFYKYFGRWNVS